MTQLTEQQVRHIAQLARLQLTEDEVRRFPQQLTSILQYVDMLKEVDTSAVEATSQVTGLENALREDVPAAAIAQPDALLGCSALPIVGHQIQTPSAH
ncbi:MAG: aspartyl-tRNA(Asn)/glutamyl-tRNA (Gln) amidotransferase subunit C [Candidatus Peregrinibacteria bacterium Gr01-1014_25]|nr:MAG: aspartyl-tRNA(Asn)/glutamyl-tRNA (Gln) amidotransferase subunit C [Candidatus Peregrinibacteria bacterium Gr01-1014_25]